MAIVEWYNGYTGVRVMTSTYHRTRYINTIEPCIAATKVAETSPDFAKTLD